MAANNSRNVVKLNGQCRNRSTQKYCSYWVAKHVTNIANREGPVIGYRCTLFDKDKEGSSSLPECNAEYGNTYDGKPNP